MDQLATEADIERAHADPRFKQILLAKSLEQLLDMLYRMQHVANDPDGADSLREGVAMAVQIADQIRHLDDRIAAKVSG